MNTIDIAVVGLEPPDWIASVKRFCSVVLAGLDITDWELSVLLCDDGSMRRLNAQYRGKDTITDILSFPQLEQSQHDSPIPHHGEIRYAGDIVISLDATRRHAIRYSVDMEEELKRLLIHGILHITGMEHDDGQHGTMLTLQEHLLKELTKERLL